jgi:23S rRNA (cytidine1920-2'-O)/16S rRNA (cytidine1409-2'-O)-methyltransferase
MTRCTRCFIPKNRLDRELVIRGLAPSRARAQAMVTNGQVTVDGRIAAKVAELVEPSAAIAAAGDGYVSRAAHKLAGALDDLGLTAGGRALDAGSSTGGFTQVLLERGCSEVSCVDVGTDQLAALLRTDPRVRVWEQTNLRDLTLVHVGGRPVDLTVADVSFISLTLIIDRLAAVTAPSGSMVVMVKPQFEVGRELLGKGGVVRAPELHRQSVDAVVRSAARQGWHPQGAVASRLPGPAGNREFFVWLTFGVQCGSDLDLDAVVGT